MEKVKIINPDGLTENTKVIRNDGTELKRLLSLDVDFELGGAVTANISFLMPELEILADGNYVMTCLSDYTIEYLQELNRYILEEIEFRETR